MNQAQANPVDQTMPCAILLEKHPQDQQVHQQTLHGNFNDYVSPKYATHPRAVAPTARPLLTRQNCRILVLDDDGSVGISRWAF